MPSADSPARGRRSREYGRADLKRLFALSYNECAFPPCEQVLAKPEWPRVQCEIAHIYGLAPGAPRYVDAMSDDERNSYENLILLCPNHHHLVDYLEPERYDSATLLDMKWAHEKRRGGPTRWCDDQQLETYVRRLALTLNITVVGIPISDENVEKQPVARDVNSGNEPARPGTIRSGADIARPAGEVLRDAAPRRRKNIRVHELANELGMTSAEAVDLCGNLGIPVKSASSSLNEAYADMVRRRALRDGLARGRQPS